MCSFTRCPFEMFRQSSRQNSASTCLHLVRVGSCDSSSYKHAFIVWSRPEQLQEGIAHSGLALVRNSRVVAGLLADGHYCFFYQARRRIQTDWLVAVVAAVVDEDPKSGNPGMDPPSLQELRIRG